MIRLTPQELERLSELLLSHENLLDWLATPDKIKRAATQYRVVELDEVHFTQCFTSGKRQGFEGPFKVRADIWFHMLRAGLDKVESDLLALGIVQLTRDGKLPSSKKGEGV